MDITSQLFPNNQEFWDNDEAKRLRLRAKMDLYASANQLPASLEQKIAANASQKHRREDETNSATSLPSNPSASTSLSTTTSAELTVAKRPKTASGTDTRNANTSALASRALSKLTAAAVSAALTARPEWHRPWKLKRVILGHTGWVRSLCVDPDNQYFATGSADRTIKVWDLASGVLRTTLTGHIMAVRGLVVSPRHPYMFSVGEDKRVKCWDLEQNKVVRDYHGHLSGVYSVDLHPTLDVIVTGSRDCTVRVWDIRTREAVHVLQGHRGAISQVRCQNADPQVISTSMDATVRLWDLAAGKTMSVLTHHKKSVRALVLHPTEFTFATGAPDNIKQWKCPDGAFLQNFGGNNEDGENPIVNTLSINQDNVMFAGGDDGSLAFYDWRSGHKFQQMDTKAVPGSLGSEAGIFASGFDRSGLRLITCEADKSIKIWQEDMDATPETDPGLEWTPRLVI